MIPIWRQRLQHFNDYLVLGVVSSILCLACTDREPDFVYDPPLDATISRSEYTLLEEESFTFDLSILQEQSEQTGAYQVRLQEESAIGEMTTADGTVMSTKTTMIPSGTSSFHFRGASAGTEQLILIVEDSFGKQIEKSMTITVQKRVTEIEALRALYEANPQSQSALAWDITTNSITDWDGITVNKANGKVTDIDLQEVNLEVIPPEMGQLSQLKNLTLARNDILRIPPEISRLSRLKVLNLQANELASVPPEIAELSVLRSLNLGQNQLSALPEEIEALSSLEELFLFSNNFTVLPDQLWKLNALVVLSLGSNNLGVIPEGIEDLIRLEILLLRNTNLTQLPESIAQLKELQILDISKNVFASIPSQVYEFKGLIELNVSSNQLDQVSVDIINLKLLQRLKLNDNQITTIPPEYGMLTAEMDTLLLQNNRLFTLPEPLGNLTQLSSLNIKNNPLTSVPVSVCALPSLEISASKATLCD